VVDEKRTHQVSLGCGTLILIALIVLIFSGRGTGDLEQEVRRLRSEVSDLKRSIDDQSIQLKLLVEKVDKKS
jgi:hypothetical protein